MSLYACERDIVWGLKSESKFHADITMYNITNKKFYVINISHNSDLNALQKYTEDLVCHLKTLSN